jgi:type IV secretion system protein VirD4
MPVSRARILRTLLMMACSCVAFGLFMLGIRVPVVFLVVAAGMAWHKARRVAGSAWSHGTARVSGLFDVIRNGMLGQRGVILGTSEIMQRPSLRQGISALWSSSYPPDLACHLFLLALGGRRWAGERIIRVCMFTHLATFAPTGRGKGVSVLIPNLLSYPLSCVVTDPKGELYRATAGIRYHKLGNRIIRLDPFGVCGGNVPPSDRFNPLDAIDDSDADFLDQCRDVADMMIMQTGKEDDPYWNDSARSILCAFIAFICACEDKPEERTLDTVRDLLSSRHKYAESLKVMQQVTSHGGVIQRLGHMLAWHEGKELASVLSNVQRHTEAFDSPLLALNLKSSTFDPRCLRSGRVTIYLCLPHDKLETLAPLMRLWIGIILRSITRGQPSEKNPVLFFLDEAAHLGKIRVLEQAVTLMRGMGIRLWFFFQSLHQLNDCFGEKAKTILDNIDTHQYFAINEPDNAEAISKRIGDATISIASHGQNSGRSWQTGGNGPPSGNASTGENINHSYTGRRLFKPEELMGLPEDVALIFHRNMPVIPARLLKYYNHPSFRKHGTGLQPGLGRAETQMVVSLLLVSILFALVAFQLVTSDSTTHGPPRVFSPAARREGRNGKPPEGWQAPGSPDLSDDPFSP